MQTTRIFPISRLSFQFRNLEFEMTICNGENNLRNWKDACEIAEKAAKLERRLGIQIRSCEIGEKTANLERKLRNWRNSQEFKFAIAKLVRRLELQIRDREAS